MPPSELLPLPPGLLTVATAMSSVEKLSLPEEGPYLYRLRCSDYPHCLVRAKAKDRS